MSSCFEHTAGRPARHRTLAEGNIRPQVQDKPAGRRRKDAAPAPDATALRPADATVSPLDLYVYLKARFGPPNDVMMVARAPGLENIIQWGYALASCGHLFRVHGTRDASSLSPRGCRRMTGAR
jgi:hypothetical protein